MADKAVDKPANLLEVRGLTRTFASRNGLFGKKRVMTAVGDVTLDVPRGKVTGVVGESGCGKSTLARLVLRLLDANQGTVSFDGVDLASLSAGALRQLRRHIPPEPFYMQGVGLPAMFGHIGQIGTQQIALDLSDDLGCLIQISLFFPIKVHRFRKTADNQVALPQIP